jgi:hypothetical protein
MVRTKGREAQATVEQRDEVRRQRAGGGSGLRPYVDYWRSGRRRDHGARAARAAVEQGDGACGGARAGVLKTAARTVARRTLPLELEQLWWPPRGGGGRWPAEGCYISIGEKETQGWS